MERENQNSDSRETGNPQLCVSSEQIAVRMGDGSFRPLFPPSGMADSFIDLDAEAVRALSRDPQRRVYLRGLEEIDQFRPQFKLQTEFSYPDTDVALQEALYKNGFRFAVLQPPGTPFQNDASPYGFGAHQDINVICHTNYRWVRQGALDAGQDMRPLHSALSRVRALNGVQIAAFMAPYTLFYAIGKLFASSQELIENNVHNALEEAAKDFERSYAEPK